MSPVQFSFFIIFGITVPSFVVPGFGNHIFGSSCLLKTGAKYLGRHIWDHISGSSWVAWSLKTGATLKISRRCRRHLIPTEMGNFSRCCCIAVYKATKSKMLKNDAEENYYFIEVKVSQINFCHLLLKTLHTLQRQKLNYDGLLSF